MAKLNVPLAHPKPDYREFIKAATTSYVPARPRLVEYLFNGPIQNAVFEMLGRPQGGGDVYWDNYIALWYHLGYDFVRLEMSLNFPRPSREGGDHGRSYSETAHGAIESWEDFEKYPWPAAKDEDFAPYEYVAAHLPDGMGLITCHAAGPL
jgi:uroporphyrinogen decarboxylase